MSRLLLRGSGILYCSQKTAISTRLAMEVWGNWGTELVCCSVLQHVATCCSVLQCDAAFHSLLLSKDGNLYSFGDGSMGQLGHGTGGNSQYSALQSFHLAHLVTIRLLRIFLATRILRSWQRQNSQKSHGYEIHYI